MTNPRKEAKPKKCKVCDGEFQPFQSMQRTCSPRCAITDGQAQQKKGRKQETRKAKKALNDSDKSYQTKKAQAAFNKFIRLRDANEPCISCGRYHTGQYHAGHYRSVGAHRELRFNELNCHKQCAPCNNHKSGDIVNYRVNLLAKIGQKSLDWLEGPHELAKPAISDLMEIAKKYTAKAKELE